jgi:hypothetical protein
MWRSATPPARGMRHTESVKRAHAGVTALLCGVALALLALIAFARDDASVRSDASIAHGRTVHRAIATVAARALRVRPEAPRGDSHGSPPDHAAVLPTGHALTLASIRELAPSSAHPLPRALSRKHAGRREARAPPSCR